MRESDDRLNRRVGELAPLLVVVGPTAVGKSQAAVHLAKALGTEILTADSRQVYRGMDIGTEKPPLQERQGVPHRLIDLVEPDQAFNVGIYRQLALTEIDRVRRQGKIPLVVGGTGLYVRALVRGLWDGPPADWQFRARVTEEARRQGPHYLHLELMRVDPDLARRLHPHDEVKIIRGLEVYHLLGCSLSKLHHAHGFQDKLFSPLIIGLSRERAALYRRIEDRVRLELAKGLVQETQTLLDKGHGRELASMKGLGYRQIAGFLAQEYSFEEAVRRLKRDTRHFAKRQLTWFRQEPDIEWLTIQEGASAEEVAGSILTKATSYLSGWKGVAESGRRAIGSARTLSVAR